MGILPHHQSSDAEPSDKDGPALDHQQRLALVGEIAAGAAHDINNLLTPLLGYAQLAERDLADEDRIRSLIFHVLESGRAAAAIAQSMVQLSRASETSGAPGQCSVRDVSRSVVFCLDPRQNEDEPRVIVDAHEDHQVAIPHIELLQILMNLVRNAQRVTPKQGGRIAIVSREMSDHVAIDVTDNGCGMSPEELRMIFRPFAQAGSGERRGAAGLGLSVCTRLAESAGGTIDVDSTVGQGTAFTVRLPKAGSKARSGQNAA